MKLYLDNCMFNRPFDDQSNFKVRLETEAKLKIQENIRAGLYQLIWSYILDYENEKNPFKERREQIKKWRQYANMDIDAKKEIIYFARSLGEYSLKNFDALHIACAISSNADYFLTADNGILKKAQIVKTIQITDPINFIREALA